MLLTWSLKQILFSYLSDCPYARPSVNIVTSFEHKTQRTPQPKQGEVLLIVMLTSLHLILYSIIPHLI